jgi:hypothetical protein
MARVKGFEVQVEWRKIRRIRHTYQFLHPLDKLGDLGFGTSCRMSVKGYVSAYSGVPARGVWRKKRARHPAHMGMSAKFTFLAQFQQKLAMCVR